VQLRPSPMENTPIKIRRWVISLFLFCVKGGLEGSLQILN